MIKILVNSPTGRQELIELGDGGGYFDATRVIWDERSDGELPAITLGGMVRNGDDLEFDQIRMDKHIGAKLLEDKASRNAETFAKLAAIDAKSIRALREWVAKQSDAPAILIAHEADAANTRKNIQ